jgi:hypothetical protein
MLERRLSILTITLRDYGTTRGFPNESEYTYVKVDFYNNIKSYLADLNNTDIRSLEDIVQWVTFLRSHKCSLDPFLT